MATSFLTEKAPPEKKALYGALGVYPDKNTALAELIDNSGEYGNTTKVKIEAKDNSITISDDGAGLSPRTMVSMFRIKRNEHAQGETGKFGYGFKSATAFLGSDTYVLGKQGDDFTWGKAEPNEDWQYEITFIPKDDVDHPRYQTMWDENKATNSDSGTIIFIKSLKEEFSNVDIASLQMFVSRTYAINFKQKNIIVELNGSPVPYAELFGTPHSPEFDKKRITFGDTSFSVSILARDNEEQIAGLTIVRNNRLIVSGFAMGIPGISDPGMANHQIVLWCDDGLDDFLKMTPMKTISPNQSINRTFRRAFFFQSGLTNEIKKIIESAPAANEIHIPLSQHTRMLTGLDSLREKLPNKFASYIESREKTLALKPAPPAINKIGEKIISVISAPKISTQTDTVTVTTTSTAFTQGLFNIDIRPLGTDNFMWDVEERLINDKLQIVVVFNYDIPFVRGIISGPRNEVASDFINEAIAQVVYSTIQIDNTIEIGYKNTYRNISRIKSQLFGG
jgi:hypothetical protein